MGTYFSSLLPADIKSSVWTRYCGTSPYGCCYVCNDIVHLQEWNNQLIPTLISGTSKDIDNYVVCCSNCSSNITTYNKNLRDYIIEYGDVESLGVVKIRNTIQ
jgi:hypothetical protein